MNPGEWDTARFAIQMTDRGPVVITDPLQMQVCRLLADGPMRPKELAQKMALASSSLHFILDKMVESDVIVRRRAEPGKKMVTYSLCSETVFFGFDPSEDAPFVGDGCPVGDLMRRYLRSIGLDAAILETGYSEVVAEVMTRSMDHCSYEESVLHAKHIVERMTGYKANVFSVSPLTVIVEGDETLEDCLGMVLGLFASVVRKLSGVCRVAGEPERFGSDDRMMFRSVFSASEPHQNVHGPRFNGEVQRFAVVEKQGRTQVVVSDVQVEILAVVSEGPSTVTEIVERSGFPRSTVTSNISKMEERGLLDSFEGESGYICYRSACHVVLMTFDGRKRYSEIGIIEEGDGFMDGYVRYAASRIESMGFDAVSMMESLGSYCMCEELMEAGKECSRFGISIEVLSMDPVRVRLSGKKDDPARAIVKGMVRRKVSSMNDRAMMVEDEDGILTFEDMGVKQGPPGSATTLPGQ